MKKGIGGFTIVELLIVIVVIAILAAISTIAYSGIQDRARQSAALSFIDGARKQLETTYIKYNSYPTSLALNPDESITIPSNLTVEYYPNNSVNPATYVLNVTAGEKTYYTTSTSSGVGEVSEYFTEELFNNTALSGSPVATNQVTSVNYNWGTGGPAGVGTDLFSARWQGSVLVPQTGVYTFAVTSDDGQRLYLNGSLVIDNWVAQSPTTQTYTTTLTQNQLLTIRYEYYEQGGGAVAQLQWDKPSAARAPITTQP